MKILVYSTDQVLWRGLELAGMERRKFERQKRQTNLEDFRGIYGTHPMVLAVLWEKLQTTKTPSARIDTTKKRSVHLKNFLRAIYFLFRYPTEVERKVKFGNTKKTIRKWCWYFVDRIEALKAEIIVWPADDAWKGFFILSVDGVHCRFHEVKHGRLSKDPEFFSWKENGPGLAYELALSTREPKLVWINGPKKPKRNTDIVIFNSKLKDKIPAGKKIVTDRGYRGSSVFASPSSHDTEELRTFKARARMRQEAFHSRIKRFNCMTDQFRHSMARHGSCFVAICVILQFEMDVVSPIWDV